MNLEEPSHKPGPVARAMCEIAARMGMGYYNALNGDAWSPDLPGLTDAERAERLADFAKDCAHRGLVDWREEAVSLGYHLDLMLLPANHQDG